MSRTPDAVIEALEATGLPYSIEPGTRHRKSIVGGRLAGILPHGAGRGAPSTRTMLNTIAQIRRVAAQLRQETTA